MSKLLPVYPRIDLRLERAQGAWLYTADGRHVLDMYGGHAVCPLGHGHPELTEALARQHATLDFYSNSLFMDVQERAAEAVLGDSAHLAYVHFLNSGTEANEAAIHTARKLTGRRTVVTLESSFHGRTLASLAATGIASYRKKVPLQVPDDWLRLIALGSPDLSAIDETVALVLLESVPSLGGIHMPDPGWLASVQARCREVGAMLVLDEVQGGVGRLGRWFAHEYFGIQPDMVTLAKSLGGGFPVSALVATQAIGDALSGGDLGTTFGGGPMACVMVETTARIIRRDDLMARALRIEALVREGVADLPGVSVRGRGCLLGLVSPLKAADVQASLLARDVMTGTSSDPHALRLLPPYTLTDDEVGVFVAAYREVIRG